MSAAPRSSGDRSRSSGNSAIDSYMTSTDAEGALPGSVAEEVSLSVEDTNKLRIALGLKPLDTTTGSKKDQIAMANYASEKARLKKREERKAIIESLAKEHNKEQRQKKLIGKGLGDASDGEDDSYSWALRHKKLDKERKATAIKAREFEEQEQQIAAYTSEDLKGLRVGHDIGDIKDEILVLSDRRILDEDADEDELVSVAVADKERLKKNLENKSKKKAYNAYDDDEFKAPGQKRSLLSHYDEEIDRPVRVGFVIGNEEQNGNGLNEEDSVAEKLRKAAVSLEYDKMQEIRDYYTQEEVVSFAKPKKRKKKAKSRVRDDPELDNGAGYAAMEVEEEQKPREAFSASNKISSIEDVNFVDDDDLQEALAKARRAAMLSQPRVRPEDVIQTLEAAESMEPEITPSGSGLVLSATSEFVSNLSTTPTFVVSRPEPQPARRALISDDDEEDEKFSVKRDESDSEEERGGWREEGDDMDTDRKVKREEDDTGDVLAGGGIEDEPLVASGLAATLSLLKQKGFVEKVDDETLEKEKKQKERAKWLSEQRLKDKLREMEREKEKARVKAANKAKGGKGGGYVDEWQLEEDNRQAERQRLRELEERFKNYTPDIEIKYTDEFGHQMNPKEAFRFLSHKFHGKSSGKMKTEKRLLRKEEELKLMKMLSNDTPLNTASALAERTRQLQSAHVVLSVGNRGVLPPDVSLAEAAAAKGGVQLKKSKGKGKAKAGTASGDAPTGKAAAVAPEIVDVTAAVPTGGLREKVAFRLALGGAAPKRKAEGVGAFEEPVAKRVKDGVAE
ncbi:SART-1 family-domain-containing protein [Zopfochytrium polystomum]|nr:SART-1 family-domain-containing protein [Zopfochytrium polystomum]